jgi:hypothetical protein
MEPESYYHIHKRLPRVPFLSQMNLGHATPTYVFKIHFNIIAPYYYTIFISYLHYLTSRRTGESVNASACNRVAKRDVLFFTMGTGQ